MLIRDALDLAKKLIKSSQISCENPIRVARILLAHELNMSFEQLFLSSNLELCQSDESGFFKKIDRFCTYEPLEYITQKASFYAFEFDTAHGVLIPRPETEFLVDFAFEAVKNLAQPRICEIGVGSGIISIVLALKLPNMYIVATDINEKAIELSAKNAAKFGVGERINFVQTNLMDAVVGEFDMIVSNPPYIATDYKLEPHVLAEPSNALFGGKRGDEILKQIVHLAHDKNVKILACEMGYNHRESMANELFKFGYEAKFYQDFAGFDRGFIACKI